jgi:hypothetical protein
LQHCEQTIVQALLEQDAGDLHGWGSWLPLPCWDASEAKLMMLALMIKIACFKPNFIIVFPHDSFIIYCLHLL